MALLTDRKFIHFNRKSDFEALLNANAISDKQIVFLKDAQEIWTHGTYYGSVEQFLDETNKDSTNAVSAAAVYQALADDEKVIAAALNDLNDKYTNLDSSKQDVISDLDTIRENAQSGASKVSNVQADWNAESGLAQILHKPDLSVYENKVTSVNGQTGDVEVVVPQSLLLKGITPRGHTLADTADSYYANELNNGEAGAWFISYSNGDILVKSNDTSKDQDGRVCLSSSWKSRLNYGGMTWANVGDILLVYKQSSLIVVYKVMSINEAGETRIGLMSPNDKIQVNKISNIEGNVNNLLGKIDKRLPYSTDSTNIGNAGNGAYTNVTAGRTNWLDTSTAGAAIKLGNLQIAIDNSGRLYSRNQTNNIWNVTNQLKTITETDLNNVFEPSVIGYATVTNGPSETGNYTVYTFTSSDYDGNGFRSILQIAINRNSGNQYMRTCFKKVDGSETDFTSTDWKLVSPSVTSVNGMTGAVTLSIPNDSNLVHKTGNETITGNKQFRMNEENSISINTNGITLFSGGIRTNNWDWIALDQKGTSLDETLQQALDKRNNLVTSVNGMTGAVTITETQLSKGTATGTGNAVTDINVSDHQITLVKGATYATQSDIDTSIANLVDSAPETLDTLNELAAALGDDPNFATTVANQIGQKYTKPSTGIPASDLAAGVIPAAPGTLNTTATTAQTTSSSEALSGSITLHKVAKTGTYNDLIGKPTIPAAVTESTISGWGFTKLFVVHTDSEFPTTDGTYNITVDYTGNEITAAYNRGEYPILEFQDKAATLPIIGLNGIVNFGTTVNKISLLVGIPSDSTNANLIVAHCIGPEEISHQSIKFLNTTNTSAQHVNESETIAGSGTINLHKVSKTGSYSDLIKPSTGIPKTDLASAVQTSLGKADSAIQGVKVNGAALTPDANKVVDVTVPTNVSDLTNDLNFVRRYHLLGLSVLLLTDSGEWAENSELNTPTIVFKFNQTEDNILLGEFYPTFMYCKLPKAANIDFYPNTILGLTSYITINLGEPLGYYNGNNAQPYWRTGWEVVPTVSLAFDNGSGSINTVPGINMTFVGVLDRGVMGQGTHYIAICYNSIYRNYNFELLIFYDLELQRLHPTKPFILNISDLGEVNTIETIKVNNTTLTPDSNKVVNITIPEGELSNNYEPSSSDNEDLELAAGDTYEEAFGKLEKSINDNEQITAAALTDLDSRINTLHLPQSLDDIPDGSTRKLSDYATTTLLATKQDALVSGTNIKTINNESLLGSGNITIQGGSGGDTNVIETVKVNGTALTPDANKAVNITVPSAVTESTVSGWGFTKNAGTITGITMNGVSKGTSGVVDLGTVITSETALSKGTTTGSGNAVTDISVSGHQITLTKGTTFLTSHQGIKTLKTDNTTAQSTSSSETIAGSGTINLHKVAKTGSYNDLNNKPTIANNYVTGGRVGTSDGTIYLSRSGLGEVTITGMNQYVKGVADDKVSKTGDTMTGALTISADTANTLNVIGGSDTDGSKPILNVGTIYDQTILKVFDDGNPHAQINGTLEVTPSDPVAIISTVNSSGDTGFKTNGMVIGSGFQVSGHTNQYLNELLLANGRILVLPTFSGADNGKILGIQNGQLAWITPTTIYTGTGTPSSSQGNNGDIYLQTS